MSKSLLFMVVLSVSGMIGFSQATPYIEWINGTNIETVYTGGTLTLSDTISIVLQYDNNVQDAQYDNSSFFFTADLLNDNSGPGGAHGEFGNGSFSINDSSKNLLLAGSVVLLDLQATHGGTIIVGFGDLTLDSGSLLSEIQPGFDIASVWNMQFKLSDPVADFSTDYSGQSDININPIPEPTTIALLGLGAMAMLRRKRQ